MGQVVPIWLGTFGPRQTGRRQTIPLCNQRSFGSRIQRQLHRLSHAPSVRKVLHCRCRLTRWADGSDVLATVRTVFEGFEESMVESGGLRLLARRGGAGPTVVLLHGHPRTSSTWHRVAPLLVGQGRTVVCLDLPGYGRSDKPVPKPDHQPHSKRAGARHILAALQNMGHDEFDLVGHDRGSYFALRLALDHPKAVRKLALLDALPISEHLDRANARFATAWWHWFFFAQAELPERAITADPRLWYPGDPTTMGEANHAEWKAAIHDPDVVRGMLEDYRAGLTIDYLDEVADRESGRRVPQPLMVLWSTLDDLENLYGDPLAIWRGWADQVSGHGIRSPHHVAEHAPEELAAALGAFLAGIAAD
jgi:haloacetate dehalogenase